MKSWSTLSDLIRHDTFLMFFHPPSQEDPTRHKEAVQPDLGKGLSRVCTRWAGQNRSSEGCLKRSQLMVRGTTEVSPKAGADSLIQQKSSCQTRGLKLPESPGVGIHGSSRDGCRKALTDHLLLTTAVAKMAAIPACWGSSWISEGRVTGGADSPPSIFPAWFGIPIGSAMTNAFSASPSERGLVVLHQMDSSGNGGGEKKITQLWEPQVFRSSVVQPQFLFAL